MAKEKKQSSMKAKRLIGDAASYVVLIIISIIWLFPFVCMALQSFRSWATESGGMEAYIIPKEFSLDNYMFLLTGSDSFLGELSEGESTNFLRWYGNTFVIALCVCILQTIFVLFMSFVLSRMRFKGRELLMRFMLILGMFPGFLTMICLYFFLKEMGLTETGAIPGIILVSVASSGMGYYVCKGYFDTIPKSLDEAARIDGASRAQVFVQMLIPLSKPIIIYNLLTAFMAPWCDYVFASYIAFGKNESYNVAVGMYQWMWTNDFQGYFTRFCAGGMLVAVPITILFMCLQKYYVEGVTGGAVKG